MCGPQEGHCEKNVKSKVAAKNGCDGRLIAKILITTIQVDLVPNRTETWRGNTNSAELSLLKVLLLAYHYSHSWPPPWISHPFHNGLLGGLTLFLQLGCFWIRLKLTNIIFILLLFLLQVSEVTDSQFEAWSGGIPCCDA